ncbi:peptidoglycan recognition family protein [Streptomyces sp. ICBB 8177]|uniref:N-acetylmuramoyl-L-alanine amidase n=1 Tax=Streptomyces sp. ICBB 8177 TaxID=563922 RepID=UPI000D684485|nr:peptidoglycan recognition family protein [Streptomyces sp. ICBB 8177]PWI42305.1 N-acetylmuramoyl-L-alanine amidase [Streptomyces sp. ICBB 8177]
MLATAPQAAASGPPAPVGARADSAVLQGAFASAATRYHVPLSVLLGVAYLESRWDTHGGHPSVTGGYGPMHLTDAATALDGRAVPTPEAVESGEPRALPASLAPGTTPAALETAARAAALTGLSTPRLRTDPAANVAGGAALLAAAQRALGRPLSADPADWFGAVARYSGADDTASAADFAADVFETIRTGMSRTTDSGQRVTLAADPSERPDAAQARALGLRTADTRHTECPPTVACEWVPAPYTHYGPGPSDYGNHDLADRPADSSVDYIVIHDTEGDWAVTLKTVRDPEYLGWHYTVRAADGHVAQHMATKDVGWHAGNWYINSKSLGVEHEGFLADPGSWYTEAMYRASARLVRYLSARYHVPLDRQHILGHDNVPAMTPATVAAMHTDPGPYWDWAHYFELLGAPFTAAPGRNGGLVTIDPPYSGNRPSYTGCVTPGASCAAHGSDAVRLYTAPSERAALVTDPGLHPDAVTTTGVNDTGARASTGQRFAVAGRQGDWTAIWYLGQKAWFHDPASAPTALNARGLVVTPRPGLAAIPVYGRAYPEASAYPKGVPVQPLTPLPYGIPAGQAYAVGGRTRGEFFYSRTFDRTGQRWVKGSQTYYEIQFGHRVAFVEADDVTVGPSGARR